MKFKWNHKYDGWARTTISTTEFDLSFFSIVGEVYRPNHRVDYVIKISADTYIPKLYDSYTTNTLESAMKLCEHKIEQIIQTMLLDSIKVLGNNNET